jgi:type I restriction enzyme S subunit
MSPRVAKKVVGASSSLMREQDAPATIEPKLRFPEFRKSKDWELTTIGALGRFYYGKSAPKWSLADNAPTPCVRYGELYTKFGPVITETYSRTNTPPKKLRFSKGGEILIPRVGEKPDDFGKCCCYLPLKDVAIGEMISAFETKQHPLFYTYYFRILYKQFAKVVEGQNVKNLYYVELESLPIHRPLLPEQQKIAECLTSLDKLIYAESQKLNALKTHKKGLMQQLFPREGETAPRLRFPEFCSAPEWCSDALGNIFETSSGGTPDRANGKYWNGNIPWITTSLVDFNIIHKANEFISDEGLINSSAKVFPKKTILVAMYGQGKTRGQVALLDIKAATNQACAAILPRKGIDPRFVFLNLGSRYEELRGISNDGGQKNLSQGLIQGLQFSYPKDMDEQHKIANCLSSLDDLITAQAQKLETLNIHKKGLMQQLFPSSDEVGA